jgi:hypothetical protein
MEGTHTYIGRQLTNPFNRSASPRFLDALLNSYTFQYNIRMARQAGNGTVDESVRHCEMNLLHMLHLYVEETERQTGLKHPRLVLPNFVPPSGLAVHYKHGSFHALQAMTGEVGKAAAQVHAAATVHMAAPMPVPIHRHPLSTTFIKSKDMKCSNCSQLCHHFILACYECKYDLCDECTVKNPHLNELGRVIMPSPVDAANNPIQHAPGPAGAIGRPHHTSQQDWFEQKFGPSVANGKGWRFVENKEDIDALLQDPLCRTNAAYCRSMLIKRGLWISVQRSIDLVNSWKLKYDAYKELPAAPYKELHQFLRQRLSSNVPLLVPAVPPIVGAASDALTAAGGTAVQTNTNVLASLHGLQQGVARIIQVETLALVGGGGSCGAANADGGGGGGGGAGGGGAAVVAVVAARRHKRAPSPPQFDSSGKQETSAARKNRIRRENRAAANAHAASLDAPAVLSPERKRKERQNQRQKKSREKKQRGLSAQANLEEVEVEIEEEEEEEGRPAARSSPPTRSTRSPSSSVPRLLQAQGPRQVPQLVAVRTVLSAYRSRRPPLSPAPPALSLWITLWIG